MFAKDFDKSIKNLFALLENLLEWARSQTGNIAFTPESFSIKEVLSENATLLAAQAEAKSISITSENYEDVAVNAHRNSVSTVIRNLISNAIKFTPEGGTVSLKVLASGSDVMVSVADTGVGMSQEVVDKLFRIDAKISTKGTANEKGTGLGLILCKEFIEKNGGRIWVRSSEGEGSVFYFLLPLSN
jgi:signal transduction histidine kinase